MFYVLFRDMPWHAVAPLAEQPSAASSTAYHGTLTLTLASTASLTLILTLTLTGGGRLPCYSARLPWNAVTVAAEFAMVVLMACHGIHHGAMKYQAT